jgi:hypothetical protein
VNVCVFAAAAMLATGLRLVLRAVLAASPKLETSRPAVAIQPAPEFRPYKPTFTAPEAPTGYSARLPSAPPEPSRGPDLVSSSDEGSQPASTDNPES